MNEQGKVALVTGASRGLGAAIATTLARAGYDIWLNYRSQHEAAAGVKAGIEALGRKCVLLPFDVTDEAAMERELAPLLEERIPDVLVNKRRVQQGCVNDVDDAARLGIGHRREPARIFPGDPHLPVGNDEAQERTDH